MQFERICVREIRRGNQDWAFQRRTHATLGTRHRKKTKTKKIKTPKNKTNKQTNPPKKKQKKNQQKTTTKKHTKQIKKSQ